MNDKGFLAPEFVLPPCPPDSDPEEWQQLHKAIAIFNADFMRHYTDRVRWTIAEHIAEGREMKPGEHYGLGIVVEGQHVTVSVKIRSNAEAESEES